MKPDTQRQANRMTAILLKVAVGTVAMWAGGEAWAWGSPHGAITRAALEVLPELPRWRQELGAANLDILVAFSDLPDRQGEDLGTFHADDYLLTRHVPVYPGHRVPAAFQPIPAYFRRALQALRTETPVNALRQMCPLIHFAEDIGAPPHAMPNDTHHVQLENGSWETNLTIAGYVPVLLGTNDDEAEAAILRHLRSLAEYSAVRCERGLELLLAPGAAQTAADPVVHEAAQMTARDIADIVHTVLTLGLSGPQADVSLTGRVSGACGRDVRIVLVDTDFSTLALSPSGGASDDGAKVYSFRGLPPDEYRVLATCRGCRPKTLTVRVIPEQGIRADFALEPGRDNGNLIENSDARVSTLQPGKPDRWSVRGAGAVREWRSTFVTVRPGEFFRLGAALKGQEAHVTFVFTRRYPPKGFKPFEVSLEKGVSEIRQGTGKGFPLLYVSVKSPRPLDEVIQQAWVVKD